MHSLTTLICCDLHFPNETATYAFEAKKATKLAPFINFKHIFTDCIGICCQDKEIIKPLGKKKPALSVQK